MPKILLAFLLSFTSAFYLSTRDVPFFTSKIDSDSIAVISISAVGDLMCHQPQFRNAYIDSAKKYDFSISFEFVKDILDKSDITIGNLETVLGGEESGGFTGYPLFNSPDEYLYALADAGFDVLSTANNHSLDRGEKGLIRTAKLIDSLNLVRIGTYINKTDRDSIRILEKNNIKIAFLSYSYGTNGNPIPEAKDFLINLIDTLAILNDIVKAKLLIPDLILIFFHFGDEYAREPNNFQKAIVQKSFEYGADIILGSHPHVVQPFELVKLGTNSKLDTGLVIYSLGNFLSNQEGIYKESGLILQLEIEKNLNSNKSRVSKINYIPTWVRKGYYINKQSHLILPLSEINFNKFSSKGLELSSTEKDKILRIINETNTHLNNTKAEEIK